MSRLRLNIEIKSEKINVEDENRIGEIIEALYKVIETFGIEDVQITQEDPGPELPGMWVPVEDYDLEDFNDNE